MSDENAEAKQKRKASGDNVTTLRTENMTSGEVLRAAREKRKLTLEDVSAAIHVRAAQLRAIEEGNIDALPGMTYAVGFVKSYASYLKLNPIELGNKFKTEHGALKPLMPDLPEIKPVVESRMPDPRLVGVAAFFAVVLLLGWTLLSGGDDDAEIAMTPPVEGVAGTEVAVEIAPENVTDEIAGETAAADVETAGSPADEEAKAEDSEETVEADTKAAVESADVEAADAETETATLLPEKKPELDAEAVKAAEEEAAKAAAEAEVEAAKLKAEEEAIAAAKLAEEETINIRKAGRIVLKAKQSTWVQVNDGNEREVFKKLLKPGEQFTVPEGSGYTLITTNAGGLDVVVDGKTAPSLGKSGEILRGVPLEPSDLTRVKRARSRINN